MDPETAKPGSKVIIVTEHVKPLEKCLSKEPAANNKEGTVWGLNVIAQSLKFITEEYGLIHGNLSRAAIFVSDCGNWKLAGFELMSENTDSNSLLRQCEQLRVKRVLPPSSVIVTVCIRRICTCQLPVLAVLSRVASTSRCAATRSCLNALLTPSNMPRQTLFIVRCNPAALTCAVVREGESIHTLSETTVLAASCSSSVDAIR